MKTTININRELLLKAQKLNNSKTKKETVDKALRVLVELYSRHNLIGEENKTSSTINLHFIP